jgi:c(7)-type cytochrome triheme protein
MCFSLFVAVIAVQFLSSCSPNRQSASRGAQYEVDSGVGEGKRWRDYREFATEVKTEELATDGIHDPKNSMLSSLQEPAEALSSFPLDRRGSVDWVRVLELGIIKPRADLKGEKGEAEQLVMDMDIIFKDTDLMPWVKFPHLIHTKWLACSNCHPAIFIPNKGANNPSMDGILAGEYCGRCHGKVAFALWTCERCHNVPHEGTPKRWNEVMGGRPVGDGAVE